MGLHNDITQLLPINDDTRKLSFTAGQANLWWNIYLSPATSSFPVYLTLGAAADIRQWRITETDANGKKSTHNLDKDTLTKGYLKLGLRF